ncbi:MAG: hypothetical protein K5769_01280 [Pseudobutyrivibrio sp.]|nr:hypothetical protein [Pseudobutyrivibrio sp.]
MGNLIKEKTNLNERQISILRSKDLPIDWDKLTEGQQQSIVAIEEMLEYLENKYQKTFCYAGYRRENPLFFDKESLLAYAEGDDPESECFTVERAENGFTDRYAWVVQSPIVQKEMEEKLEGIFEGQKYKMFVKLTGVSGEGVVESLHIYIYIENTSMAKTDELMEKTTIAISGDSRVHDIDMYCFDKQVVEAMTDKNHQGSFDIDDIVLHYKSDEINRGRGERWNRR